MFLRKHLMLGIIFFARFGILMAFVDNIKHKILPALAGGKGLYFNLVTAPILCVSRQQQCLHGSHLAARETITGF